MGLVRALELNDIVNAVRGDYNICMTLIAIGGEGESREAVLRVDGIPNCSNVHLSRSGEPCTLTEGLRVSIAEERLGQEDKRSVPILFEVENYHIHHHPSQTGKY